ncbi:MAG: class I SAM-dependent methyltransferase [Ignavibacteria bacterium]|nr:class I SAM-dependent methyltransferase [Ignavibacteria bacterium]
MNIVSLVGHVLELVEESDRSTRPLDRLVAEFFRTRRYLGSHDRRFVAETLYGIVRYRRFLETLLEQYVASHPAHSELDKVHVRYLPLAVIYAHLPELSSQSRSNISALYWKTYFPSIDLDSFLAWIQEHSSLDFLNTDEVVRLGVRYSFQDWMVQEWMEQLGSETEQLLASLNQQAPVSLRVNTLKASREELQKRLQMEGIETELARYSPVGLIATKRFNIQTSSAFKEGWFEVQDEGSQLVALIADPQPGQVVIDGCAGAGGKALHMAEMMGNDGELVAIDLDAKRLKELESRTVRAGVRNIRTQLRENIIPENFLGKGDVVLVDAPCTGVGTIRRNPMFKWRVTESLVQHFSERQCEILAFNAQFVKPGGRLVYATCSMLRRENEDVIQEFLAGHPGFRLMPQQDRMATIGISVEGDFVRLYPHRHGTDGFFIAMMERG